MLRLHFWHPMAQFEQAGSSHACLTHPAQVFIKSSFGVLNGEVCFGGEEEVHFISMSVVTNYQNLGG